MSDIFKILELTSKSHEQPVYLLNEVDRIKLKMVSPSTRDEIKYRNGEIGTIGIGEELHKRTLNMMNEITKEQYEDNNFPRYQGSVLIQHELKEILEENSKTQLNNFYAKIDRVFEPRMVILKNHELEEDTETVFHLAYLTIIEFFGFMLKDERCIEILYKMFGGASDERFDNANRLLIFWFLWQRDLARGLTFLKSEKVRDGLNRVWSFSELEINNLTQEFNLAHQEKNSETFHLWIKLQEILGNNDYSPLFVFPALSVSLKENWKKLDILVGDNI